MNTQKLIIFSSLFLASTQINAGAMGPIDSISENCRNLYIRGDIGANFFHSSRVDTSGSDYQYLVSPNASISNSIGYTGGVGYQLLPKLRGDVTFTYRPNLNVSVLDNTPEIGRGTLRNYTLMANLYLDIDYFNLPLVPYFMGGIGSSWFKGYNNLYWPVFGINEYGQTKQNFAWQIGTGTTYKVCENFLIDINYQFISLGTASYTGHYDRYTSAPYSLALYGAPTQFNNVYDNQIQIGIRYYIA